MSSAKALRWASFSLTRSSACVVLSVPKPKKKFNDTYSTPELEYFVQCGFRLLYVYRPALAELARLFIRLVSGRAGFGARALRL